MKQTSVEWLFEKLWETPKDKLTWYSILEKAKQMEKEQIMDAWDKRGSIIVPRYFLEENINGEQYYNETFKSE
jgi:hypothetical protein